MRRAMLSFLYLLPFGVFQSAHAQDSSHIQPTLHRATMIAATCLVLDGGLYFYNNSAQPPSISQIQGLSISKVPAFERFVTKNYSTRIATITDVGLGVILAARGFVLLDKKINRYSFVVHCVENFSMTVLLAEIAKASTLRYRPYMYNPAVPLSVKQTADGRYSFFSMHTALASSATFYSDAVLNAHTIPRNKRWLVWTGAAIAPALIGWGRVASGQHFVTDVAAGYVVGAACGLGTYYFSRYTYNR